MSAGRVDRFRDVVDCEHRTDQHGEVTTLTAPGLPPLALTSGPLCGICARLVLELHSEVLIGRVA